MAINKSGLTLLKVTFPFFALTLVFQITRLLNTFFIVVSMALGEAPEKIFTKSKE